MTDVGSVVVVEKNCKGLLDSDSGPGFVIGAERDEYLVALISQEVSKYSEEPKSIIIDNEHLISGRLDEEGIVRAHRTYWAEKSRCKKIGVAKKEFTDKVLRLNATSVIPYHYDLVHRPEDFVPGKSPVPVSGRVYGPEEIETLVDSAFDFWLTAGRFSEAFEQRLAEFLGVKHVLTSNSGSSANLLAISALTSPKLKEKRLKPGDEVITVAAGFPTTVNPIIQNGLVPVFVDVDIPTYNIRSDMIEAAVSEKTRAIMLAHTLGNPFDIEEVLRVAQQYDLWLIEDCCDALGSRYRLDQKLEISGKTETSPGPSYYFTGTFGAIATFSFYPAHHITMGEGGAVVTNDSTLKRIIESLRDWGRDCWCAPGHDNTCGRRFSWQLGELPKGYDHKYIYSHMGYNFKITDMQAAVGLIQLERLPQFIDRRKANFRYLKEGLKTLENFIVLPEPMRNSDPAWFGFPVTLRDGLHFSRTDLLKYLDQYKVGTRLLFGGNLTRQPYFKGHPYRVIGSLNNTDRVMNHTFWVGVYPGLDKRKLDFVIDKMKTFFEG